MKKLIVLFLCLLMALPLAGCGAQKEKEKQNQMAALFDAGYTYVSTRYDETSWAGLFQKDNILDSVYVVKAAMTASQYKDYSAIEFDDAKAEAKQRKILCQLENVTLTDVTDRIPTAEELASYIGMTMGELEAAGFEKSGYSGDPETGYEFFFDGPVYSLYVFPKNSETMGSLDDYSENDLRGLTISKAEFMDFSYKILDE